MADSYIDYFEVGEYGDHFVREAARLVGQSPLVDMEALRASVAAKVAAVDAELAKVGIVRSGARQSQSALGEAVPQARRVVQQFFNYLGAQDDDLELDLVAFFPGGRVGNLARMKAADLDGKIGQVLKGFDAPLNANLPEAATWKARLDTARGQLKQAASQRGGVTIESVTATAGLTAAHKAFIQTYNGVAKKLVAGVLTDLGRSNEYRHFFKDLQVNESRPAAPAPAAPAPSVPAEPVDA